MAQLRHDFERFEALGTQVAVIVPNGPRTIARHVDRCNPPYAILSDKGSRTAAAYGQTIGRLRIGAPALFVVNCEGIITWAYYATSLTEEPDNSGPLGKLEMIGGSEGS